MSMTNRIQLKNNFDEYCRKYGYGTIPLIPSNDTINQYKQWCKDRVGANGWNYYGMHRKIPFEFRFKRAEDMLAFKLTFGL